MPKPRALRSSLILLLTAAIWGIAFVAQRVGMAFIGPFLFASTRSLLGALTLTLFLAASKLFTSRNVSNVDKPSLLAPSEVSIRKLIKPGIICGCFLLLGSTLQQVGLVYTTASKAGFLTALYIVLVPVLGICLGHKAHWNTWFAVVLAVIGLYYLSITESFTFEPGDFVVILGAFFWAGHILSTDHFVAGISQIGVLKLCIVQFTFAGCVALALTPLLDGFFVAEVFNLEALRSAMVPIMYAGVMSTGVAFTLQAIGQQGLPAAPAAIIMSLEAVFSVIGGMLILSETLTQREVLGCVMMFAAVLLAQLPVSRRDSHEANPTP